MKIAVIGGGAAGMATAYFLDKQGHHVTVFERQPVLGGNIRTLNKNVRPNRSECSEILESGPLEFPNVFHNFVALMKELDVKLLPVDIGSELLTQDGDHFLSGVAIRKNFTGIQRWVEYLRFNAVISRSAGLWLKTKSADIQDFYNRPLSHYLKHRTTSNLWLKLITMYSYSIPFEYIDDVPAELAIPMLRDYLTVKWFRVEGGVYSYIEKILERFKGDVLVNTQIANIYRDADGVKIERSPGDIQSFNKVVLATPPDRVMSLLADPNQAEIKRFSAWKANSIEVIIHRDNSMYEGRDIKYPSEFDFFQPDNRWGYNGYLNQLCGISSPQNYFLSFQLEDKLDKDKIIHLQKHQTPFYTTEAFRYRDEVVETNGENNTYHAGAYLGDGLHEGAIASAVKVAQLIG